jgi:hypothetical protein
VHLWANLKMVFCTRALVGITPCPFQLVGVAWSESQR